MGGVVSRVRGGAATPGEESEVEGCKKGAGNDRDEVWGAEGPRRGQQKGASGRVLDSRNTERRGVGRVRRWAGKGSLATF